LAEDRHKTPLNDPPGALLSGETSPYGGLPAEDAELLLDAKLRRRADAIVAAMIN
jgi:hypothetical protein